MKIKKGDTVFIKIGKDSGSTGVVEKVLAKMGKVVVAGKNVWKKAIKKDQKGNGGIVSILKPISVDNVRVVCPECGKPTRVGFKVENNKKVRICKKCGKVLSNNAKIKAESNEDKSKVKKN